ncbi:unnamed protein product [Heligmosomoides polygyrus]|uniref:Uncharacterized protein n=1 Tax=Heligmosomoides polygyrus TaxID=6339 RepID=A0A3P7YGS6_HELPZ|nr:unnamed protein product [Heligmosomoides polygyrus]
MSQPGEAWKTWKRLQQRWRGGRDEGELRALVTDGYASAVCGGDGAFVWRCDDVVAPPPPLPGASPGPLPFDATLPVESLVLSTPLIRVTIFTAEMAAFQKGTCSAEQIQMFFSLSSTRHYYSNNNLYNNQNNNQNNNNNNNAYDHRLLGAENPMLTPCSAQLSSAQLNSLTRSFAFHSVMQLKPETTLGGERCSSWTRWTSVHKGEKGKRKRKKMKKRKKGKK